MSRPEGRSLGSLSMFRCKQCQCVVPPRTPSHRLTVKRRSKEYPYRSKANVVVRRSSLDRKPKKVYLDDPGGSGEEIVSEVLVCPACALLWGARNENQFGR
jgi:hypothetical protein